MTYCKHCNRVLLNKKHRVKCCDDCYEEHKPIPKKHIPSAKDRARARDYAYKRKYGITLDEYNKKLEEQGGRCAICKDLPIDKNLCVDHCHTTGEIRALLCNHCNLLVGSIENLAHHDSHMLVLNAVEYIRVYKQKLFSR